jgi:hypothetical protein
MPHASVRWIRDFDVLNLIMTVTARGQKWMILQGYKDMGRQIAGSEHLPMNSQRRVCERSPVPGL